MTTEKFTLILAIKQNFAYLCTRKQKRRGVAQLVARYVRDVEVGSSSLLTPTKSRKRIPFIGEFSFFICLNIYRVTYNRRRISSEPR